VERKPDQIGNFVTIIVHNEMNKKFTKVNSTLNVSCR